MDSNGRPPLSLPWRKLTTGGKDACTCYHYIHPTAEYKLSIFFLFKDLKPVLWILPDPKLFCYDPE
jgi:hypothetical protein